MTDYTFKEYVLADIRVRYIITETKKVFLQLLPVSVNDKINDDYYAKKADSQFSDMYDWFAGALCHISLSHNKRPSYSNCFKFGGAYDDMYFEAQECIEESDKTVIKTTVASDEGYEIIHSLTSYNNEKGFRISCEFINNTGKTVRLEAITSASLDGLSPYCFDDNSQDMIFHTFRSGWATEGKHIKSTLRDLNIEKSWGGNFTNIKIGSLGSRSTFEYFPYAAAEDMKRHVIWGVKPIHNGTWQIDLSRHGRDLSLSCGLGDSDYGNWFKDIKDKEHFIAPEAFVAVVNGDISDLSDVFIKMCDRDIDKYAEDGMGITFNEWCTSWGKPSHEKNLKIADKLSGSKVKYFVMDAGWYEQYIGDWEYKKKEFPYGLKCYTDEVRKRGFIPGIWMEFECSAKDSKSASCEYDDMHLKNNGSVIYGAVNKARYESFWDFRNPKTIAYLEEHVIKFLKDNGFGYLKVDYNANIGTGCDGAESPGEGLRQHTEGVYNFFKKIKEEIPDIIIENCSSGGMRLDSKMMSVTAMSSFSDAHECYEFPIVAANLHYLIPPCQSQIWNVLKPEFGKERFQFTVSAGFLGRICWSGNISELSDEQMNEIYKAEEFYEEVSDIIRHGKSKIFRTEENYNFRFPIGTQAVIRYSDDGNRALLVYHSFNEPKVLNVPLDGKWSIKKKLYDDDSKIDSSFTINNKIEAIGNVILLEKVKDQ